MAKTLLTKNIEKALETYSPSSMGGITVNKFRPSFIGFEVPSEHGTTKRGIIDAVSVNEYFGEVKEKYSCGALRVNLDKEGKQTYWTAMKTACRRGLEEPDPDCAMSSCILKKTHREFSDAGILVTCYEIKITESDFKSSHGHNFAGNLGYYVMPKDLWMKVKGDIPDGIGAISYSGGSSLRKVRDAVFSPMTDDEQKWMLLSVMKSVRNRYAESIRNDNR